MCGNNRADNYKLLVYTHWLRVKIDSFTVKTTCFEKK